MKGILRLLLNIYPLRLAGAEPALALDLSLALYSWVCTMDLDGAERGLYTPNCTMIIPGFRNKQLSLREKQTPRETNPPRSR